MKVGDLLTEHSDGSFEPEQTITITSPDGGKVIFGSGVRFRKGVRFMGLDLAECLEWEILGRNPT